MSKSEINNPSSQSCPKRLWVLGVLADDESYRPGKPLPHAVQLHLSQCESCRAHAERTMALVGAMAGLGEEEPAALASAADERVRASLRAGGELTGRVEVPELAAPPTVPRVLGIRRTVFGSLAAAAAVLIVAGLGWRAMVARVGPGGTGTQSLAAPGISPQVLEQLRADQRPAPSGEITGAEEGTAPAEEPPNQLASSQEGPPSDSRVAPPVPCPPGRSIDAILEDESSCIPRATLLGAPAGKTKAGSSPD